MSATKTEMNAVESDTKIANAEAELELEPKLSFIEERETNLKVERE
jgi:hypothetical protein